MSYLLEHDDEDVYTDKQNLSTISFKDSTMTYNIKSVITSVNTRVIPSIRSPVRRTTKTTKLTVTNTNMTTDVNHRRISTTRRTKTKQTITTTTTSTHRMSMQPSYSLSTTTSRKTTPTIFNSTNNSQTTVSIITVDRLETLTPEPRRHPTSHW